tara:strand:- start:159779 stop:159997 length:219 start_codon:yes stop_codon:yes gene_type:complete
MTSRDFCFWLQGYLEIADPVEINKEDVEKIKNHLNLVFKHEIDPSIDGGDADTQTQLNNIHNNGPFGPTMRC